MCHFQESHNIHQRVPKLRSIQEQKFSEHLHKQRRTNARYYNVTCKLKVDFISFSVWLNKKTGGKPDETKLYPMFTDIRYNGTSAPQYNYERKYSYDRSTIYQYEFDGHEHEIVIAKCSYNYLKPYIIRLHDPTLEVLEHLQQYFGKFDRYHIKDIEFTYDFQSEDIKMMHQYLQEHVIVSWRGKGFQIEEDTFYGNNIRFAHGKGLRVYEKEVENEAGEKVQVARMEMLCKRPILKKNGIHTIKDFINMDTRVSNKYLSFRNFNYGRFIKHMKKISHPHIAKEVNNIRNGIRNGYLYEMNISYKDWYKETNKNLKENYKPTYLYKNKFWDHFISQCKPWYSFLDGNSFQLSSALMEDGF